jgi:hypothetical protein
VGVSTDAIICYGIPVKEDVKLPWNDDNGQGDIEDWWLYTAMKFCHTFDPYDKEGNRLEGTTDDMISAYHAEADKFLEDHPCPVELIWHCSYDYPMFIIALPGSLVTSCRGDVTKIDPDMIAKAPFYQGTAALHDFIYTHKIPTDGKIGWHLVSMWG